MVFSVSATVGCGKHEHAWGGWTSNGDNTHSRTCTESNCPIGVETEVCEGTDVCEICGGTIEEISTDFGEIPEYIEPGTYNKAVAGRTEIKVCNFHGGIGSVWIDQAAERYAKIMAGKSYATGKRGVYININKRMGVTGVVANASTSPDHIFFAERQCMPTIWGQGGVVMSLNDIVYDETRQGGTLENSIFDTAKAAIKGKINGQEHYFALPHYEFHGGASYNREIFDEYGAYFADESCNPEYINQFESKYGNSNFIFPGLLNEDDAVKSVGPDGLYGTEDDGLPASFEQLVVLCEFFKTSCEISPFVVSGKFTEHTNYFITGLWTALAGQEQMLNYYDFNGKVEVVTGFTNEPIMEGVEYIKKPITEWVDMTTATGYYGSQMAAKYYAIAFLEILEKEGYYSPESHNNEISHLNAQSVLIYGGKASKSPYSKSAMLMEASYWYNESEENLCFDNYITLTGDTHEIDLRQMALPTAYTTAQHEARLTQEEYDALSEADRLGKEAHRASALIDIGQAYCLVNNNIKDNEEIRPAVIDFVNFLYSESELRYFTMETGMPRAITYELSENQQESMGIYYKKLWQLRDWQSGSNVIYNSPGATPDPITLDAFLKAKQTIVLELSAPTLRFGTNNNFFPSLEKNSTEDDGTYTYGTKYCFETSKLTSSEWRAFAGELIP